MSADIAYRLLVDLSTKGTLSPQLDKMGAQAKGLDAQFAKLGQTIGSSFSGAAGMIERVGDRIAGLGLTAAKFGALGTGAAVAFGVKLNAGMEQAKIGLASVFNAQGIANGMDDGLQLASKTLKEMRKDARDLPGEFKDLQSFFTMGATPGFQLGASVKQLEKLSAHAMAAAAVTQVPMDQAAREFTQLLEGRAGAHNVFGSKLGLKAESFNHLAGGERLKAIEKAVEKHAASIPYFAQSLGANVDTMKDTGKQLLERATAPLTEKIKDQFGRANKWFEEHEGQVGRFADKVGYKLADGFEVARRKIEEWGPPMWTFFQRVGQELGHLWDRAKPLVHGFEKLAKSSLASPHLIGGLKAGATAYGGIKAAGAVAPMVGGLSKLVGDSSELAGAGAALGGVATATVAAGAAAVGLAGLLFVAGGAMHALTDESSAFHEEATRSAETLTRNMSKTLENLTKVGDLAGPPMTRLADALGVIAMAPLAMYSDGIEKATFGLGKFSEKLSDFLRQLHVRGFDDGPPGMKNYKPGVEEEFVRRPRDTEERAAATKIGAGGGGGGTHIQKVEIVVSTNQDPSRIARLTADILTDRSRFPTSSPTARNFSAARPR
jgi:hypothetical protein